MNYADIIWRLIIIWGTLIAIYNTHKCATENRENIHKIMDHLGIPYSKKKK